jgi:hypothetical protein
LKTSSGERGIRTPGGVTLNGFQDRRNRPLCHLSGGKSTKKNFAAKKKMSLPEQKCFIENKQLLISDFNEFL